MQKSKINEILNILEESYPNAKAELNFSTVFELLVAVILSAQCTDKRVNLVTEKLFKVANTAEQFSQMTVEELIPHIKSCGLSPMKAKGIVESSKIIVEKYNGVMPSDLKTLQTLPSVGRKTACVVASVGYGVPAIAVDTHVFRVSNRIGLANADNVKKTEEDLCRGIAKERWNKTHHLLIFHGRYCCKAQKPMCSECALTSMCKFYKSKNK